MGLALPASAASAPTPLRGALPETPEGYIVSAKEASAIADDDPNVVRLRDERGKLTASVSAEPPLRWEVGYYAGDEKVVLVVLNGISGETAESWTGDQVLWPMARGHDGQFGHILNSAWVWAAMAAVFLFGLLDWRHPWRIVHLDLLVLLSFGISQAFFNSAEHGVSVPLYYPPLLYLLGRALWIGFRGAGEGLRPRAPTAVLTIAIVVLLAFRIGINVTDSGVIDVGYAGVVGADRLLDAEPVWGEDAFPANNRTGDTYGPANYLAYVPFEQAFAWSGEWDDLPAAHAAAIAFDLACIFGLFLLGRRLSGGNRVGVILAFAWLAYPYTAFVTQSNANDSLLAALLIWSLVVFASPLARGALLAAAALTKFAPLVLVPLYFAGERGLGSPPFDRARLRSVLLCVAGFAAVAALLLAHPAVDPGLSTFWERTIGSQAGRESPFSIWGQVDLGVLQTIVKLAVVGLVLLIAFLPRDRDLGRIAALAAAAMIAIQLVAEHWFYLYIVWFLPLLLVALVGTAEQVTAVPARRRLHGARGD